MVKRGFVQRGAARHGDSGKDNGRTTEFLQPDSLNTSDPWCTSKEHKDCGRGILAWSKVWGKAARTESTAWSSGGSSQRLWIQCTCIAYNLSTMWVRMSYCILRFSNKWYRAWTCKQSYVQIACTHYVYISQLLHLGEYYRERLEPNRIGLIHFRFRMF